MATTIFVPICIPSRMIILFKIFFSSLSGLVFLPSGCLIGQWITYLIYPRIFNGASYMLIVCLSGASVRVVMKSARCLLLIIV